MTVVFSSGLLHLADAPEEYARRPVALRLLRDLPTAWDESRLLTGRPGRDVAVARRHGERWYVGAVTAGPGGPRRLSLAFLRQGRRYRLTLVTDGQAGVVARRRSVSRDTRVTLRLASQGGAVLRLAPG